MIVNRRFFHNSNQNSRHYSSQLQVNKCVPLFRVFFICIYYLKNNLPTYFFYFRAEDGLSTAGSDSRWSASGNLHERCISVCVKTSFSFLTQPPQHPSTSHPHNLPLPHSTKDSYKVLRIHRSRLNLMFSSFDSSLDLMVEITHFFFCCLNLSFPFAYFTSKISTRVGCI